MCISKTTFFSELCITKISSLHLARLHSANWHCYLHQQSIESQAKVIDPMTCPSLNVSPKIKSTHYHSSQKLIHDISHTYHHSKNRRNITHPHPIFQAHNHPKSFLWDISPLLPPSSHKASSKVSGGSNSPFPGFWTEWKITAGPLKMGKKSAKGDERTELGNLPVCFFFLPLVFGVRSTILVDPQKLFSWFVQWFSSPTSFSLMLLVFLEVPSLPSIQRFLRIQQGILIQLSPIDAGTTIYHVTCRMPENSKSLGPEFRKKRHLPKIIVWPSGRGWWSQRVLSSKHRLISFGGLSLVCDWRYACLPETNGFQFAPEVFSSQDLEEDEFSTETLFGMTDRPTYFQGGKLGVC